jgi:hypothetical protein
MMLSFLLYRQVISDAEYRKYHELLLDAAWYGNRVVDFGESLYRKINLLQRT